MGKLRNNHLLAYLVFWVWLLVVSYGFWIVYSDVFTFLWAVVTDSLELGDYAEAGGDERAVMVAAMLQYFGAALIWWRMIKVLVLQGSPLPLGMTVAGGRQNEGKSGRPSMCGFIGDQNAYIDDYKGRFWYGVVFRAHPSSDKLMRSRLEFLLIGFPAGLTFSIHESRWFFKKADHHSRAKMYRLVADKYAKKSGSTTPDRFRTEVVRHMRAVGSHFEHRRTVRRIDGLNWHNMWGGEGFVMDDFGLRISFKALEDGRYKVSELGPDADEETIVESVEEFRRLARRELNPTYTSQDSTELTRTP